MKALTIWQPWAELIIRGFKEYETRSRPIKYRGKIAIHAAQYHPLPHEVYADIAEAIGIPPEAYEGSWIFEIEQGAGTYGAIIGTADLVGSFSADGLRRVISEREAALGDFTSGRHGWKLERPMRFDPPIPARGKQGLWELKGAGFP